MKIVRAGMLRESDHTWWHNRVAVCSRCQCSLELEPEDEMRISYSDSSVTFPCPTPQCGGSCRLTKPSAGATAFYRSAGVTRQ